MPLLGHGPRPPRGGYNSKAQDEVAKQVTDKAAGEIPSDLTQGALDDDDTLDDVLNWIKDGGRWIALVVVALLLLNAVLVAMLRRPMSRVGMRCSRKSAAPYRFGAWLWQPRLRVEDANGDANAWFSPQLRNRVRKIAADNGGEHHRIASMPDNGSDPAGHRRSRLEAQARLVSLTAALLRRDVLKLKPTIQSSTARGSGCTLELSSAGDAPASESLWDGSGSPRPARRTTTADWRLGAQPGRQ